MRRSLHVRVGLDRICITELPSSQPLRYSGNLGAVAPLHVGSAGKVLMAFLPAEDRERALAAVRPVSLTYRTVTDHHELRQQLVNVERRGWALSEGERIVGVAAISVPVRGSHGVCVALSVLGPLGRMSEQVRLAMLPDLQRAALAIEDSMAGAITERRRSDPAA